MIEATHQNFPPGTDKARVLISCATGDLAGLATMTDALVTKAKGHTWQPGQRVHVVSVKHGDVVMTLEHRPGDFPPEPTPKGKRGA